jgi:hypothetical protein
MKGTVIRAVTGVADKEHILSILKTLFPSGSTLFLAESLLMKAISLVHKVYAFVSLLPAS